MKGRLSSTIWTLAIANAIAFFGVIVLAYIAGWKAQSPIMDVLSSSTPGAAKFFLFAVVVAVGMAFVVVTILANRVIAPVKQLSDFSEKLASGDYKAKADIDSQDDFAAIAENF